MGRRKQACPVRYIRSSTFEESIHNAKRPRVNDEERSYERLPNVTIPSSIATTSPCSSASCETTIGAENKGASPIISQPAFCLMPSLTCTHAHARSKATAVDQSFNSAVVEERRAGVHGMWAALLQCVYVRDRGGSRCFAGRARARARA